MQLSVKPLDLIVLHNNTFYVCVEGVYIKGGKILLLKRSVEPFKGCWHLAGGHVEETETLKEALKIEFEEETSLDIDVGNIIDGRIEETFGRTKIIATLEVVSARGEIIINSESEDFGWFAQTPANSVHDYAKYLKKRSNPQKARVSSNARALITVMPSTYVN